jgi:hypothetical protein
VVIIIIAAVSGGSSKHHHAQIANTPAKSSSSKPGNDESRDERNARAYIHQYGQLASQVQASVQTAEIELGIFAKSP